MAKEYTILRIDGDKCIMQIRGVHPFLSNKFDITSHKRHKKQAEIAQRSGKKEHQQAAENDMERERK